MSITGGKTATASSVSKTAIKRIQNFLPRDIIVVAGGKSPRSNQRMSGESNVLSRGTTILNTMNNQPKNAQKMYVGESRTRGPVSSSDKPRPQ